MVKLLHLVLLLCCVQAFSQGIDPRRLFSYKVKEHLKQYANNADNAYAAKDYERGEFLFDSLVRNVVNKSYMDNFKFKKLSGKTVSFHEYEKPVFLMTYASWCTPGAGEIPALNKVVEAYHPYIDFVILFWNSKDQVKAVAKEYHSKIDVVYIDETENIHDHVIISMKHSLGFPTSFFISSTKQILDVRRGVLHPYAEEYEVSYSLNYDAFLEGIALLFTEEEAPYLKSLLGQN